MLPDFFLFSFFRCSADHERDWPPCKVVFFGLAINALNVKQNRFDIFHKKNGFGPFSYKFFVPIRVGLPGGCSEGLDAFRFFFKQTTIFL